MSVTFVTIDGIVRPIQSSRKPPTARSASTSYQVKAPQGFKSNKDAYSSSKAFTIPNTACPVCGSSVFYYQHPNGARVYFEELGPPWTKHPCTSSIQTNRAKGRKPKPVIKKTADSWKLSNWQPFVITKKIALPSDNGVRIEAVCDDFTVRFDLNRKLLSEKQCRLQDVDHLVVLGRRYSDSKVELSMTSGWFNWNMFGERVSARNESQPVTSVVRTPIVTTNTIQFDPKGKEKIAFTVKSNKKNAVFSFSIQDKSIEIVKSLTNTNQPWLKHCLDNVQVYAKKQEKRIVVFITDGKNFVTQTFKLKNIVVKTKNKDKQAEPKVKPLETHDVSFYSLVRLGNKSIFIFKSKSNTNTSYAIDCNAIKKMVTLNDLLTSNTKFQLKDTPQGLHIFKFGKRLSQPILVKRIENKD
ncbi:hypothetical protein [Photobacterium damselae]|uniref:hypothetical protein n=1 Tax=Photobacterium damselae TaxID=38293 RepID=UPI0040691B92